MGRRLISRRSSRISTAIVGSSQFSDRGYYDGFGRKATPDKNQLIREYKQTVYTCANLNANSCLRVPRRLYLKTDRGDSKSILRPNVELRKVNSETIDRLAGKNHLQKTLRSFVDIEEVVIHPSLTQLDRVNQIPEINGYELVHWSHLYLDITGITYWLIEPNALGLPQNIWLLPTQFVEPVKEEGSTSPGSVDYYSFQPSGLANELRIKPEFVLVIKHSSLTNPYGDGLAPTAAEYTSVELANKFMSLEAGILDKRGIPDVILTPDGQDSAINSELAERMEGELHRKFSHGRSGGFWVAAEQMKALPLSIPVRDIARLEVGEIAKADIAASYGIPFALISRVSHNREQLEAAEIGHAKHAISPRVDRVDCALNDQFIPRYDTSGRLFFASDDPVPETAEIKLQENVQLGMNGFKTPNEVRKDYDLPPMDGGDELRAINVSPEMMRQQTRDSGEAEK